MFVPPLNGPADLDKGTDWTNSGGAEIEDDQRLVECIARGEVHALAQLYERHVQLLLNLACRMLSVRTAAEDLVQDVFVEVWRRAYSYQAERGSVQAWLVVRLRSRALDYLRSARVRREVRSVDPLKLLQNIAAPERTDYSADHAVLHSSLDDLPQVQRQVLELAYFQGLTSAEISALMSVPVGTVKSRLSAGIRKVRAALTPSEGRA